MKLTVSIIIPTLEEAANIGKLLESLSLQTYHELEIIVVDGDSADKTAAIVHHADQVRLLKGPAGVSLQRNAGARAATGDILFFIDADTTVEPDFVHRCVDELVRRKLDMACPHYWPMGSTPFIKLLHTFYNGTFWTMQKLVPSGGGSCIIVRRELFERTTGFEQGYPFDDMKFLSDARRAGGRFGFIKPVIGVSDRRFRSKGVMRTALLYALLSPLFLLNLHSATKWIRYNFGHYDK